MTPTSTQDHLLTIDEVAARLSCTPRLVRAFVDRRELPVIKVGRLVRFDPADVDAYIQRRRREAIR